MSAIAIASWLLIGALLILISGYLLGGLPGLIGAIGLYIVLGLIFDRVMTGPSYLSRP